MADILAIAGSPSAQSRSSAVLGYVRQALERQGLSVDTLAVRDLPAEDLIFGRFDSPVIKIQAERIQEARAIVLATPIYKAAYSGVLKAFLDLLPQQAFSGKIVLPIATGGSPAHLLAIDYALRPVIAALGGQYTLQGVYVVDSQVQFNGTDLQIATEVAERLNSSIAYLTDELQRTVYSS